MKRRYERPSAYIEEFTPNEYVAACGDSGTIYKFKCTAGGGEPGGVYKETNGQAGLQIGRGGDKRISRGEASYHACGETHEASVTDDFIQNCYYIPQSAYNWRRGWDTSKAIDVVVWRGPKGNNTHCTTNLDPKTWEQLNHKKYKKNRATGSFLLQGE